ncbi:MAG TPA: hypothetical protein VEQ41_01075 [Solirubrobacterales bacterium]|nr:hypothetical protein [Solirubrobacterales bacterium]
MNRKLKILGVGLLAVIATSALAAASSSAETGGHFVSDGVHTTISSTDDLVHLVRFSTDQGTPIECTTESYSGTTEGLTVTQVTIAPQYKECLTQGQASHTATVDIGGCTYRLTIANLSQFDNTVHLHCPTGVAGAVITHPNCTMRIPPQTPSGGVVYTGITEFGKHAFTVDVTARNITTHYEGGICIFLGTTHTSTLNGSVIVSGRAANGTQVNITATG